MERLESTLLRQAARQRSSGRRWVATAALAALILSALPGDSPAMAAPPGDSRASTAGSVAGQLGQATPSCPCSLWDQAATPELLTDPDPNPVELGVKFRADVDGFVTGIRFLKGPRNTGTHVANLWTAGGTRLASATFSAETAGGWQQVSFGSPVAIRADTTYVASYHTEVGLYSVDEGYFAASGVDRGPLHALSDGEGGGNGVYAYRATSAFPTQTYRSSNYWVDVVFVAAASPATSVATAASIAPTQANATPTSTPTTASTATPTPSPTSSPAPSTPTSTRAPSPTWSPAPGPAPPSSPASPTLLARYLVRGPMPDYGLVRYQPRQFAVGREVDAGGWRSARVDDTGPYAGWDVLNTPDREISTILGLDPWLELELNRPAQVAVVWRASSPPPNWLQGWTRGAEVRLNGARYPTYIRSAAAGPLRLGSVYDPGTSGFSRDAYLVLVGEDDGRSTPPPPVPVGRASPQPNQTCPPWVHDQYVTVGPDGQTYATWHAQIDPVYWCYFHHEHGSDPAPHRPPFGYAAARGRVQENHEGFKVYTFKWEDKIAVVTHHFGTASAARAACVRFHELDLAIYRGEVLQGSVFLLADHGRAVHAGTGIPLRPAACPKSGDRGGRQ